MILENNYIISQILEESQQKSHEKNFDNQDQKSNKSTQNGNLGSNNTNQSTSPSTNQFFEFLKLIKDKIYLFNFYPFNQILINQEYFQFKEQNMQIPILDQFIVKNNSDLKNLSFPDQITILIVDDSQYVIQQILYQKTQNKIIKKFCRTSQQAKTKIEDFAKDGFKFNLILIDTIMPGEDGLQLAQHLNQNYSDLNLVAMVEESQETRSQKYIKQYGFKQIVFKPLNLKLDDILIKFRFVEEIKFKEKLHILIVDDNIYTIQQILYQKSKIEMIKHFSKSAKQALEKIIKFQKEGFRYHYILIDTQMPEFDGLWLIEEIKQIDQIEKQRKPKIFQQL